MLACELPFAANAVGELLADVHSLCLLTPLWSLCLQLNCHSAQPSTEGCIRHVTTIW